MKLAITGDISIKPDCEQLFADCKGKELFNDVVDVFKSCDRVLVNLECAITEKDTPIKKIGPNLKAPLNTAKVLKDVGVTDCGISNNHIFDYGKPGIIDTIAELEKQGLNYTGFGNDEQDARKNLIITDGKIKVAVIAVCEHEYSYALPNRMGARAYDPYDTNDDIAEAKKTADYVVVTYHGGKEECRYPSPRLVKACRSMIKHGADVVLCQHSHCIGCYEDFMGGHILYGQGNFHFVCKKYEGKDGGWMWNTGLMALLDITESGVKVSYKPVIVDGPAIRLTNEQETKRIFDEMEERNQTLKDGTWYERFREVVTALPRYHFVPEELKEKVAHFIDCEAHADVMREVYQTLNISNELD